MSILKLSPVDIVDVMHDVQRRGHFFGIQINMPVLLSMLVLCHLDLKLLTVLLFCVRCSQLLVSEVLHMLHLFRGEPLQWASFRAIVAGLGRLQFIGVFLGDVLSLPLQYFFVCKYHVVKNTLGSHFFLFFDSLLSSLFFVLQSILQVLNLDSFQLIVSREIEDALLGVRVEALGLGGEKLVHSINFILYSSYMLFFHQLVSLLTVYHIFIKFDFFLQVIFMFVLFSGLLVQDVLSHHLSLFLFV